MEYSSTSMARGSETTRQTVPTPARSGAVREGPATPATTSNPCPYEHLRDQCDSRTEVHISIIWKILRLCTKPSHLIQLTLVTSQKALRTKAQVQQLKGTVILAVSLAAFLPPAQSCFIVQSWEFRVMSIQHPSVGWKYRGAHACSPNFCTPGVQAGGLPKRGEFTGSWDYTETLSQNKPQCQV